MNFNHKLKKYTAFALAAGTLVTSAGVPALASPLAGATQKTVAAISDDQDAASAAELSGSTVSGVSQYLKNMLTTSKEAAAANEKKEAEEAVAVAAQQQAEAEAAEAAAQAEAAKYASLGVANANDYVYIRSAADQNSDYTGKLYAGSVASVDGEEGDWYHVTSGDVSGYIRKDLLTVGDKSLLDSAAKTTAVVNTTTLKVRSSASTDASVVTLVAGTTEYGVFDTSIDGWVGIHTDDGDGYVSSEFVSVATEYTYAESKQAEEARLEAEAQAAAAAAAAAAKKTKKSSSASSSSSSSSSSKSQKTYSAAGSASGNAVVAYASQFVGNPYVYGGSSLTNGTDCSGFVKSVYAAFGVSLPHSSSADRGVGYGVSTSEMAPGDIVCYSGHVGIYAGNGQIVNALNRNAGITYTNVNYSNILAVRRIF